MAKMRPSIQLLIEVLPAVAKDFGTNHPATLAVRGAITKFGGPEARMAITKAIREARQQSLQIFGGEEKGEAPMLRKYVPGGRAAVEGDVLRTPKKQIFRKLGAVEAATEAVEEGAAAPVKPAKGAAKEAGAKDAGKKSNQTPTKPPSTNQAKPPQTEKPEPPKVQSPAAEGSDTAADGAPAQEQQDPPVDSLPLSAEELEAVTRLKPTGIVNTFGRLRLELTLKARGIEINPQWGEAGIAAALKQSLAKK